LKKNNSIAWEQDRITYVDKRIYIPNNKKIKEQILQENHDLTNISYLEQQRIMELIKKTIGGQDLKKTSRNTFKNASNVNKIRSNIRRNLENYTYLIHHKDHGKRLILISLDHCPSQTKWMLLW